MPSRLLTDFARALGAPSLRQDPSAARRRLPEGRWRALAIAAALASVFFAGPRLAQADTERFEALAARYGATAAELVLDEHQRLIAKVEDGFEVPVIVELTSPKRLRRGATVTEDAAFQRQLDAVVQRVLDRLSDYRAGGPAAIGLKRFRVFPGFALRVTSQRLQALLEMKDVLQVTEDHLNPPLLGDSTVLIGADASGSFDGFTGAGRTVAVLDTGVQTDHPFLSGKTVAEACYSTDGLGSTSLCPGGVEASTDSGSGSACDPSIFGCDHGTHVAGIAVGSGGSFSGVAKNASLIAIKVFTRFDSRLACGLGKPPCISAYDSDVLLGLERVYALRGSFDIASANLSLGGGRHGGLCFSSPYNGIIDQLRGAGIATVFASGNEGFTGSISSPACSPNAISVGSTTKTDTVSEYSNSADVLDLLAPGSAIESSVPGDGYAIFSGTSMAAPHVAGAWAVLEEATGGQVSVGLIESALKTTGKPITDTRLGAGGRQKPRIAVTEAVRALQSPGPEIERECLFDWAEIQYSGVLSPAGAETGYSAPYYFRHYTDKDVYLGLSDLDNHLYYLESGQEMQDLGLLQDWLSLSDCQF